MIIITVIELQYKGSKENGNPKELLHLVDFVVVG